MEKTFSTRFETQLYQLSRFIAHAINDKIRKNRFFKERTETYFAFYCFGLIEISSRVTNNPFFLYFYYFFCFNLEIQSKVS